MVTTQSLSMKKKGRSPLMDSDLIAISLGTRKKIIVPGNARMLIGMIIFFRVP
jgi:hypothetical protein